MHCVLNPLPPPRAASGTCLGSFCSKQWMIVMKGTGNGMEEKMFNSDNLKYLSAGHGSAWKNEEDMDTQPMTAESVPQLLKLQLAVTEGGL